MTKFEVFVLAAMAIFMTTAGALTFEMYKDYKHLKQLNIESGKCISKYISQGVERRHIRTDYKGSCYVIEVH